MSTNKEARRRILLQLTQDLGSTIVEALQHEKLTDIKVGEDGQLWCKWVDSRWKPTGEWVSVEQRLRALNTMASLLEKALTESTPLLSGELPTGERIEGAIPPASPAPSFVIRRHAPQVFTLEEYVRDGIIAEWQECVLREHVKERSNIVISGATSSGKTTLVNALLALIGPEEHVVIIEDTVELQPTSANISRYKTGDPHPTMLEQVKRSLRRSPDRIVIGETRDKAGLELLKAWDTGQRGGITTVHASCGERVCERFAQFCEEAGVPPQWRLMQSAIDLIGHMESTAEGGRRLVSLFGVPKVRMEDDDTYPVPFVRLGKERAHYD